MYLIITSDNTLKLFRDTRHYKTILFIGNERVDSILFMNNTCIDGFPLLQIAEYASASLRINDVIKIMKSLLHC